MSAKTILIGGVVAAALITAGVMMGSDPQTDETAPASGLFFPDFDENSAQAIEVAFEGGSYRLERDGETWGLASKGGYPVDLGKLRTLLLAIDGAEIVDQKTDDPTRHARLGLQDEPAQDDMHWRRLEVEGANGSPLAALILGKRTGSGRLAQVFARRTGEDQTWLISVNGLSLPTADADWIDKQILKIGRDRVRSARVTHPDGEVLTVSKSDAKDAHYRFHELGDRELRYVSAPDGLGSALEYLKLDDVVRSDEMDFGDAQPTRASFWTWDGVRLDIDVFAVEDTHWARLSAAADPEGSPQFAAAEDDAATDTPLAEAQITPESRQADVDALNARLSAWTFQLPTYNASSLTKRATDYVEAPKPVDEEGEESEFLSPGSTDAAPVPPPVDETVVPQDESADAVQDAEETTRDEETGDDAPQR
jgi:uncharacterized protein DUF4340